MYYLVKCGSDWFAGKEPGNYNYDKAFAFKFPTRDEAQAAIDAHKAKYGCGLISQIEEVKEKVVLGYRVKHISSQTYAITNDSNYSGWQLVFRAKSEKMPYLFSTKDAALAFLKGRGAGSNTNYKIVKVTKKDKAPKATTWTIRLSMLGSNIRYYATNKDHTKDNMWGNRSQAVVFGSKQEAEDWAQKRNNGPFRADRISDYIIEEA